MEVGKPTEQVAPSPRKWGWAFFWTGCLAAAATVLWPRHANELPGQTLPLRDKVQTLGGEERAIEDLIQPVTLVHFYASWCAPCAAELPSLLAFADTAQASGLGLLLVAVADSPERASRLVTEERKHSVVLDPDWELAHAFGTFKLPETHLLSNRRVVERFIGASDWEDPRVRTRILARLGS